MKAMKNWKVELAAGGEILSEVKIQRGIFQKDLLLLLHFFLNFFFLPKIQLYYIFRKCTGSYKFSKSQEKINCLMYMDDIKIFTKNEKKWRLW